jgi:hypothetical protein
VRRSVAAAAVALALATGCGHRAAARRRAELRLPLVAETLAGQRLVVGGPGPVRLVELWATWCTPCGPAAERARAVLARHPGVLAYAVSIDEDRAELTRLLSAAPPGTALILPGGPTAAARAGIPQVPTFLALDTRGRLVGVVVGLSPGLGPALERLLLLAEGKAGQPE